MKKKKFFICIHTFSKSPKAHMLIGHMLVFICGSAFRCEANVNICEVEQKTRYT